jgi:N12 class adenine-specific DNA methylase
VFDEPGSGQLLSAAEYLSGNVRDKLAAAREAALDDPAYLGNVEALQAVLPAD